MVEVTVSEARANLRAVLERVKSREEVAVTQNGLVVAVLVHPAELRTRRSSPLVDAADRRLETLAEARRTRPRRGRGLTTARADQLVRTVRGARDEG